MTKFSVDYSSLDQHFNKQKVYKLKDVQDRITKVAFDVVRFIDGDHTIDNLWRIENTTDGDVIVAMYDENNSGKIEITASNHQDDTNWSAMPDKAASSMTIFYKNDPIKKVALKELNVENKDANVFCKHISVKLATNKNLVKSLLESIDKEEANYLLNKYPELNG